MASLSFRTETTALLVMDCQNGIIGTLTPAERAKVVGNLQQVLAAGRRAGMLVVYVVVWFRPGYPEVAPRNARFQSMKEAGRLQAGAPDAAVADELRPQPGEPVVVKKRTSGFSGSDLQIILTSHGIDTLVLTGVSTLGVVESTARGAFDLDYRTFTVRDCCSDADAELHELAMDRFLSRVTTVCSAADFIAALGG